MVSRTCKKMSFTTAWCFMSTLDAVSMTLVHWRGVQAVAPSSPAACSTKASSTSSIATCAARKTV